MEIQPTSQIPKAQINDIGVGTLRTTTVNKDNRFLSNLSQTKFTEEIKQYLPNDSSTKVNEEQLQFAIINSMLSVESKKLGDEFTKQFAKVSAQGTSTEDNVKIALQALVTQGSITDQEASSLNGISFDAAQLDNNLTALYDGKGSANDPTIAVAALNEALEKASAMIQSIRTGKTELKVRPLSTPSNIIQNLAVLETAPSQDPNNTAVNGTNSSASANGFLWKPISESNGRLVVLLPPSLAGQVNSTEIHSSVPPSAETFLDQGKFSSNANGGRDHFRFSKEGGGYPDGAYVVARLRNGQYATFQIGESSARNGK